MDRTAMLTSKLKVVFLLNVLASSILAAGDEVYGLRGGAITLAPGSFSLPVKSIVWKHDGNKAIEWEDGIIDVYREFRPSTFLDPQTGEMRITKLDSSFNGVYSSDVNGVQATKKWTLTVLDPVSKPITDVKCIESTCELSCKNDATVKVQCAWRQAEELRQSDGTLKLEKTDDKVEKAYICNCSNPVSFAVSDQISPFRPGDEVYGKRGGEITLAPGSFSPPLVRIVWKHGNDKAIEWEGGQTDAYRQFKGSTSLDTKTGEMTITKLDPIFNGEYSADVNGVQPTKKWTLTVLDPVSEPITKVECSESMCVLSCKNKATVEVQCAWRKGEEELWQSNGTLKLEKTDDKVGKAYICNCSNPVSFAESDQVVPFPPETLVGL